MVSSLYRRAETELDDPIMLKQYQVRMGIGISLGTGAIVIVCMTTMAYVDAHTNFLTWGPDENVSFVGFPISSWTRWFALMMYSLTSQIAQSLVSTTLSPWMSNVVRDHKTEIPRGNYCTILFVAIAYNLFGWLVGILDIFVYITCQLQYLLPALISDVCITIFTTHRFVRAKETATRYVADDGEEW